MSTFKITKKNALSDNRTNIYDLHEKKLEHFKNEKRNLETYIQQKEKILGELKSESLIPLKRDLLNIQLNELESKINNILNETEQTKYLLDFLCIINKNNYLEYHNNIENGNTITNKLIKKNNSENNMDSYVTTELDTFKSGLYNEYIKN